MAHDIIVIGTSAGGVEAMKQLTGLLPRELPASLFLTIHTSPTGPAYLAEILTRAGKFHAVYAYDHEQIKQHCIYIAAPDRHLTLTPNHVVCSYGPKENRNRPSIDVMFRSAAETFGSRVVGVVLTGFLDDGSEGLLTIREKGGLAVVQDPKDAPHPDMPANALRYAGADYIRPLVELPSLLMELSHGETADMTKEHIPVHEESPTKLTCPECGGLLTQDRQGAFSHFRCHVGHAYSLQTLKEAQEARGEASLWASMQIMEENADINRRLAKEARMRGDDKEAAGYEKKVEQLLGQAKGLQKMLERSQ